MTEVMTKMPEITGLGGASMAKARGAKAATAEVKSGLKNA